MKKIKALSFQTQIFLSSVLLIVLPSILLSVWASNKTSSRISQEYHSASSAMLSQMDLTLDTLLSDAGKITTMPLLNNDIYKAMITDYTDQYLVYAQDSTRFRDVFKLTNRLNSALITCVFENRHGYFFEYNVNSYQQQQTIEENIRNWAPAARESSNHTYFAPLQERSNGKTLLPMIKIVYDGYNYSEIGVCYCEIDFRPIADIFDSSQLTDHTFLIYNTENELIYSSSPSFAQDESSSALLADISAFSSSLEEMNDTSDAQLQLSDGQSDYAVSGCVNATTKWRLIQLVNNDAISLAYRENLAAHFSAFLLCALLGLLLSAILSRTLTRPVSRLCASIDSLNPEDGGLIDEKACGSNQELLRLVRSFNSLCRRLMRSLQQNYETELGKQQLKIQMLQFQINHHFLYNTLNSIKSLANLHNVPEIETIALCMSDLIRYNLEKFPVAPLKEELCQVKRYMTIQNLRFPGKFTLDIQIPPEYLEIETPVFVLQPLIENCIEHGFSSMETGCYISITCQMDDRVLHLFVADNGQGIPPEKLAHLNEECRCDEKIPVESSSGHHSIGLKNVSQRLRSYFGSSCGLYLESSPGEGTIIDVTLPSPVHITSVNTEDSPPALP
ncbi:ATPase/histidine kinase/DNA gyrase B/HSP90 domain protein [Marvinbryantia formatexigens DSM 14469]|uniref:ATPase/histidine kinase/DNA gyrase B/HSP90 domain protein n=1 Tax=Marvinbryantia formatexigens DSM 14469 TaxID=478749 RepID=C6L8Y6_9FIRM|nr:histidine kinase [Marvinbryantia formatexigens]EET62725.1 ATPase/histidine kinase/DNA gyrase B/HSP90 domain protein [Marvinbryantia formatexigens DSM 14469]UWO23093.1 histidine kinase [Marvinbryantia formatexigens DSM 14469]SDF99018.1 HAMP domain-containing protein [Marvinbryantia formatexigens]